jgi:hypothetical protein
MVVDICLGHRFEEYYGENDCKVCVCGTCRVMEELDELGTQGFDGFKIVPALGWLFMSIYK